MDELLKKLSDTGNTTNIASIINYESCLQKSVMSVMMQRIPIANNKSLEIDKFNQIFGVRDQTQREKINNILNFIVNPALYTILEPKFPQGYNILSNKGTSSTELNSSIFEYLYTNLPFYCESLEERYYALLKGFLGKQKNTEKITVFHGTNFPIHSGGTFKTFAFFSTSLDFQIARSYGKIVYAILVPSGFPYVNLEDRGNKQILLPIATKIKHVASIQNVRFCEVVNDYTIVTSVINSLLNIQSTPCKDLSYISSERFDRFNKSQLKDMKTDLKGSSKFYMIGNDLIKQSVLGGCNPQYTYLRCLNEILASKLYKLFDCLTLDIHLVIVDDKYAIKSTYLSKIQYCLNPAQATELLRGYIVDCVLANWDVGYFKNVGYHDRKLIRTDVGGSLAYRARGEFKLSFFNNYDINEHITMLSSPLIKQCVQRVGKTPEDLANLMYQVFDEHNNNINMINNIDLPGWPEFFTKQVLQQVQTRIDFYKTKSKMVKQQIIDALKTQSAGAICKRDDDENNEIIPSQDSGTLCGANSIIRQILAAPKCTRAQGGKIDSRRKIKKQMKIVSWNVNGIRAVLAKDKQGKRGTGEKHVLQEMIDEYDPDVLCLQETKCPEDYDAKLPFEFSKLLASKTKKGYSGVAIYSKVKPIQILDDFSMNEEGRVLVFEFDKFYVMNTYTPNSKPDLSRLQYRTETWEKEIRAYVNKLQKNKPVIYVSDFNVAHTELDIYSVKGHERAHGFTIEERTAFSALLKECDLIDSWREKHPGEKKYTWYSNFAKSRERNRGWRIDAALVSKSLKNKIENTDILSDYMGSDHVPVYLSVSL